MNSCPIYHVRMNLDKVYMSYPSSRTCNLTEKMMTTLADLVNIQKQQMLLREFSKLW